MQQKYLKIVNILAHIFLKKYTTLDSGPLDHGEVSGVDWYAMVTYQHYFVMTVVTSFQKYQGIDSVVIHPGSQFGDKIAYSRKCAISFNTRGHNVLESVKNHCHISSLPR